MDFWRTVMVLFRRWYITLPAFVATLAMAFAAGGAVPLQFSSVSVLVLTTPLSGGTESTQPATHPNPLTNPLLNFDQSLALTASIVIQQLNSTETAQSLGVEPGAPTTYEVNNGSTNPELLQSGPFVFVEGTGPTPEAAQQMAEDVSRKASEILAQRQRELNAPESTHIEIQEVVPPVAGRPLTGSPLRAAAAAGALAALASLVAVFGFESLMTYRRRRKAEKKASAGHDDPFVLTALDLTARTTLPARPDLSRSGRLGRGTGPGATDHRVNGMTVHPVATGGVGVLETEEPADPSAHGPATEER
ncbi:MAG TPA: hypothetical protein VFV89_14535 [Nocardioides sp.]|uniref:hypothetical protein n=1 Tax=Nocardioides sp. TaxID=35761 RepID=UPI002E2F85C7|nr:hypothetical protein [Nocardioides sp.]HEX5089021.1 hypothetical protein [Nocardioides sp.]